MSTTYYDLAAAANGTGTALSPFNLTGWNATTFAAGNTYLIKRGNVLSGTFSTVAGTIAGNTVYGAWYYSDGSDEPTLPRPRIVVPVPLTTLSTTRSYLTLDSLELIGVSIPPASDTNVFVCGTANSITNCKIRAAVGGIAVYGKSGINIQNNLVYAVSHRSNYTNCCIIVSDSSNFSSVSVTDNIVYHLGGGSVNSHAMRVESTVAADNLTALVVSRNTISPIVGGQYPGLNAGIVHENRDTIRLCPFGGAIDGNTRTNTTFRRPGQSDNVGAIGIRAARAPAAQIEGNTITGLLEGIMVLGGGSAMAANVSGNYCCYNRHFGIHLTTDAISCSLVANTCSYNGTRMVDNTTLLAYGRGIEITSAAGQSRCASHVVLRNDCSHNYNWGGPSDNGSEGVGIGLDDGAVNCTVLGNVITDNEGNGIQLYGGGSSLTYASTNNFVVANYLRNNCTDAITNRRTGGTFKNNFNADIACAWTYGGGGSLIANNTHGNYAAGSRVCISQESHCQSIQVANNIFLNIAYPIVDGGTPTTAMYHNNDFYGATQKYSDDDTDVNGVPRYTQISFNGTSDKTFDPLLDAFGVPTSSSPAIKAGADYVSAYSDRAGTAYFAATPTLGMYEVASAVVINSSPGGRKRAKLRHGETF